MNYDEDYLAELRGMGIVTRIGAFSSAAGEYVIHNDNDPCENIPRYPERAHSDLSTAAVINDTNTDEKAVLCSECEWPDGAAHVLAGAV